MKCSFCGKEIKPGTGLMYVKKDGKILYLHVRKCKAAMLKLKRKARYLKWTKFYEKGSS